MPIYEYECANCNRRFERLQRLSDPLLTVCPNCGGGVHKAFSVPAIQFKGSGWYVTDYGRSSGRGGASKGRDRSENPKEKNASAQGGSKNG